MNNQKKWDKRFLNLAKHISTWSKDPSTQVGCVIVDKDKRVVSMGYNGFAKGVNDSKERYNCRTIKYDLVIHSEINALIFSQKDISNCTIYTYPMPPCARCTAAIIQSGIKRIVSIKPTEDQINRWGNDFDLSKEQREEANIEFVSYNDFKENKCSGGCKCKKEIK